MGCGPGEYIAAYVAFLEAGVILVILISAKQLLCLKDGIKVAAIVLEQAGGEA